MNDTLEQEAFCIADASIRRHSMDVGTWLHTVIGEVHPGIAAQFLLEPGELCLASGYLSDESWWVISTRRIASRHQGVNASLDPRYGVEYRFGNFKGITEGEVAGVPGSEIATVTSRNGGPAIQFEYETGKASMAPIYACRFWALVKRFHHGQSEG